MNPLTSPGLPTRDAPKLDALVRPPFAEASAPGEPLASGAAEACSAATLAPMESDTERVASDGAPNGDFASTLREIANQERAPEPAAGKASASGSSTEGVEHPRCAAESPENPQTAVLLAMAGFPLSPPAPPAPAAPPAQCSSAEPGPEAVQAEAPQPAEARPVDSFAAAAPPPPLDGPPSAAPESPRGSPARTSLTFAGEAETASLAGNPEGMPAHHAGVESVTIALEESRVSREVTRSVGSFAAAAPPPPLDGPPSAAPESPRGSPARASLAFAGEAETAPLVGNPDAAPPEGTQRPPVSGSGDPAAGAGGGFAPQQIQAPMPVDPRRFPFSILLQLRPAETEVSIPGERSRPIVEGAGTVPAAQDTPGRNSTGPTPIALNGLDSTEDPDPAPPRTGHSPAGFPEAIAAAEPATRRPLPGMSLVEKAEVSQWPTPPSAEPILRSVDPAAHTPGIDRETDRHSTPTPRTLPRSTPSSAETSPQPFGPGEAAREPPSDQPNAVRASLSPVSCARVVSAVRMSAARDGLEVHLRLHPESLGDVRVNVRWERGALTAHLEVATPAAREALEGGLGVLRTTLNEQGVPVERLHVTVRLDVEARSQGQQAERQAGMVFGPPSPPAPRLADEPEAPQATPGRLDIRI